MRRARKSCAGRRKMIDAPPLVGGRQQNVLRRLYDSERGPGGTPKNTAENDLKVRANIDRRDNSLRKKKKKTNNDKTRDK